MHIVHVAVHVKPEHVDAFVAATQLNAANSRKEPGVTRFEVLRVKDTANRFVLVEHYKTLEDQLKHRETAHYRAWRDVVADMMAEARSATVFHEIAIPASE
jgi:autoinducer 2-degrading protein